MARRGRVALRVAGGTIFWIVLLWKAFQMHIPDGFLATPVWAALDVAAAPAVGYLARRAQRGLEPANVPLLGVMGAFVFAAQMINFRSEERRVGKEGECGWRTYLSNDELVAEY